MTSDLSAEQSEFSEKWTAASNEERRQLADLAKVYPVFNGATRAQIKSAFGPATKDGIDNFGDDVMRYELGAIPETDGLGKYHLTFVFQDGKVVSVTGNLITIAP
jgi:hypothetical protein